MNVCMLVYSFYDDDSRVMRYAETLARRGDQVEVVALRRPGGEHDSVVNGVPVHRIQTRQTNEKKSLTYLVRTLSFLLRSTRTIARLHHRRKFDLIHVHSVPDFLVFAALYPKLRGAKVILDIHDVLPELYCSKFSLTPGSLLSKILVLEERISASVSDHVIIANELWRRRIVARSVPPSKCTSLVNYPDGNLFNSLGQVAEQDRFVILFPGSLNWHQGLDIAIRAFARISLRAPHADLRIYGNGPDKQKLIELVQELDLQSRVFFHKSVGLYEISQLMRTAGLGIVPKRNDLFGDEAFSTKTLEFMSLGVPLVVAATSIDKHYFNDSLVKFFRPGDDEDLARAMLELIQNRSLREALARNGLAFARRNDWQHHQHKYLHIVDGLVSGTAVNAFASDMLT